MDINTQLKKEKFAELERIQNLGATKEIKLLDGPRAQEKLQIANQFGNNSIVRAQTLLGQKLELEKKDEEYDGDVYTVGQILNICKKYNLTIARPHMYTGDLSDDILERISNFNETKTTGLHSNGTINNFYYVIAPKGAFNNSNSDIEAKYYPAVIYQIPGEPRLLKLVASIKGNMTVTRLISGYNYRSRFSKCMTHLVFITLCCGLFTLLLPKLIWIAIGLLGIGILYSVVNAYNPDIHKDNVFFNNQESNLRILLKS